MSNGYDPLVPGSEDVLYQMNDWYVSFVQSFYRAVGASGGRPLSEQEVAQIKAGVEDAIITAAAGNTALATQQIALANADIDATNAAWLKAEAERTADSTWGEFKKYLPVVLVIVAAVLVIKVVADVKTVAG